MGKKKSKPEEPKGICPKCQTERNVIHTVRTIPNMTDMETGKHVSEAVSICKTCHTMFPRWMGEGL